jgi:hypothetical protein
MAGDEDKPNAPPEAAPKEGQKFRIRGRWPEQEWWEQANASLVTLNYDSLLLRTVPTRVSGLGQPDLGEHEKTRQLISEKLAVLANREDLLRVKEDTIGQLSAQIESLRLQLDAAVSELAKTRDLEETSRLVCETVRLEHEATRERMSTQIRDLQNYLEKFTPPRRFFRVTFGILSFFCTSVILSSWLGVRIVEPFWALVGMVLSAAMLLVIYLGMRDVAHLGKKSAASIRGNDE